MIKYLFTLLVYFLVSTAWAQEITIIDATTEEPIIGVAVFNALKTKSEISDFDGKLSLDKFEDNERLTFQHVAFVSRTMIKRNIPSILRLNAKEFSLDQVVISASKFEQSKKEVPQKIISLKTEDILFATPQTSADLLQNSGQVFIQKSQLGGGSPMIRGFSTNRLLLSVDGVRMNNAIFRGGNVQNVISIDPFSIQNTEVILGAGSVIYGSDAIGGVMNFYSQKPNLSDADTLALDLNVLTRYASASQEKTAHVDVNLGYEKWAFYSSISYTDFDDLKMGKFGPDDYLRPEYVETVDGEDQIITNSDPRIQRFTGYDQINFLQKAHYKMDEKMSFDLGLHYTSTSDYPRYDRLIRYENDLLRSAEWSYGPQRWFLGNLQMTVRNSNSNLFDQIKFTLAYQNFKEGRIDRNLNSEDRRTRKENVDAISANIDFEKSISDRSKIFYGAEYLYNRVGSSGITTNITTNESQTIASRYPDGSTWQSAAAYFSYKYRPNKKLTIQSGIRYNHILINADLSENNTYYNFPFSNANLSTGALTGTAGLSWAPNDRIQWKFNASTAFRAPNIDDVGKLFDSEPGAVVVPNANLKPEHAYGAELGVTLNFENNVVFDFSTYYTYLDNALVRRDFSLDGQPQIIYDGELSTVQAIQNASKAWIYGFEAGAKVLLTEHLKLTSQISVIGGSEEELNGIEVPVRHVAPTFGNVHLIWTKGKLKLDGFIIYNSELSFDQLAPSEAEKDYLYALDSNGNPYAPAWYTLNFRSQYEVNDSFSITATIENLTNQRYRPYSSGISAPGTNVIVAVKYSL
ncbi:MAG: TonB-dependent receptor [Bacteroidia bacterium]|nr:TonB-dependent receptor [Bacteroidia bacterium]MBT8277806.1 TonB-dependent receptor [Bacteroidia bacterium]NND26901.1 TonB-dependent receptor [Flavobacteriaceae bacterium]NNK61178.1 TonB-dependent receptor [Flavobacteriaceae bacterium]RZW43757.1 MAG: TonB-dependent receptor [Flavobacteriaceae bacterium]